MTGDLEGTSSWTVSANGDGCSLVFEEEVEANKRLLRLLAPIARPAFTFNHSIMMRRGQAGLRKYLAALKRDPASPAEPCRPGSSDGRRRG